MPEAKELIDNGINPGRWANDEHERFLKGLFLFYFFFSKNQKRKIALSLYGKNWKLVEEFVGTRTGAQIRSHAQKYFIKLEKERRPDYSRGENPSQEERPVAKQEITPQKIYPTIPEEKSEESKERIRCPFLEEYMLLFFHPLPELCETSPI